MGETSINTQHGTDSHGQSVATFGNYLPPWVVATGRSRRVSPVVGVPSIRMQGTHIPQDEKWDPGMPALGYYRPLWGLSLIYNPKALRTRLRAYAREGGLIRAASDTFSRGREATFPTSGRRAKCDGDSLSGGSPEGLVPQAGRYPRRGDGSREG